MPEEELDTAPRIIDMPAARMAVLEGRGMPAKVISELVPVLYKAAYALESELKKQGSVYHPGALRARYPEISQDPSDWRVILGTPVPREIESLDEVAPETSLRLEDWQYGKVAEILHLGDYDAVEPTMSTLEKFVTESGYEISGPYEEEYLSGPEEEVPKTIIRFEVRKK